MSWGFDWLLSFVDAFWSSIVTVVQWFVSGIGYILQEALWTIFDGMLTCISAIIAGLNLGNLATLTASSWGLLPSQLCYLLVQSGISNGLGMIGTAITIRMTLNLIPSWLTRL
jgi:hypothetical protein